MSTVNLKITTNSRHILHYNFFNNSNKNNKSLLRGNDKITGQYVALLKTDMLVWPQLAMGLLTGGFNPQFLYL